ncbi:hypothetical protein GA0074692_5011 [Micromonospora pallida]|uniref:Uncharacterized protein n=1 Tax=Micromonospora pallida TaxID=145854 RepID=A0A1C6T9I9_9ACTN|nr:hypothetical protein [Micromonospora pallida]SCL38438.1 hypothetical protein GA0074692_5011 [Micromonospora pallida]
MRLHRYTSAPPAAVAGPPARLRCRSPRALGLRAVPIRRAFHPADNGPGFRALRERLLAAYADDGHHRLAWELREAVYDVARNRAKTPEERRAVLAWTRYTLADALPAWLATAAAEGWPRPGARRE